MEPADADILIVDDNRFDAQIMQEAFKKCNPGKKVVWMDDSVKARDYLLSLKTADGNKKITVLLDLSMPKIGGLELMRAVRAEKGSEGIEFIVLTGSCNGCDVDDSYRSGAVAFINKDIACENCLKFI